MWRYVLPDPEEKAPSPQSPAQSPAQSTDAKDAPLAPPTAQVIVVVSEKK